MANPVITRSFVTAIAYAWAVTGKDDEGKPTMEKVGHVEFVSTKPNQTEAFRALKNAGIKCAKSFVGFDVVEETVYAMSVEKFMELAVPVKRLPNGRVDTSEIQ